MYRKVLKYIEKHNMLEKDDKVLVGVSGGADSMCLLLMLIKIRESMALKLHVIHVNHCLRGEAANSDALFVRDICKKWNLDCTVREVDVKGYAKEKRFSEEEAARILRYRAFEEVSTEYCCNKIAVAHHADDQAETVLFQIFRGSGLRGASGISPVRGNIIRPLLCVDRNEIEDFLKKNNVGYCTDATNFCTDYTRNKLRLELLPFIKNNINKGIVSHLNSLAEDAAKTDSYLQKEAERAYDEYAVRENGIVRLSLNVFNEEDIIISYVFRECIGKITSGLKDIGRKHIEEIFHLAKLEGNKEIMLPGKIRVIKEYDKLVFAPTKENGENERLCCYIDKEEIKAKKQGILLTLGDKNIRLTVKIYEKNIKYTKTKCTNCFDYDKIKNVLSLRNRKTKDFIVINKDGGKKKLKDYFIDEKIPKSKRDEILVVADASHIMWVVGYRMSEAYKVDEHTNYVLEIEVDGG